MSTAALPDHRPAAAHSGLRRRSIAVRASLRSMRMRSVWMPPMLAFLLVLSGCAHRQAATEADPAGEVARMMAGHFDSADQAANTPGYSLFLLTMVPIWPERRDGHWLYVEQAAGNSADKPYRQRVYRLTNAADGRVVSEVFAIEPQAPFVNGWRTQALAELREDMLRPRSGCTVYLRRDGAVWRGGTEGKQCASERSGAVYATSVAEVEDGILRSWDRGFDANDVHAWGARAGGYVFVRRTRTP